MPMQSLDGADAKVLVRLATDLAGNVGVHQLSQSIDISGLVPCGTIRGVVPVGC